MNNEQQIIDAATKAVMDAHYKGLTEGVEMIARQIEGIDSQAFTKEQLKMITDTAIRVINNSK